MIVASMIIWLSLSQATPSQGRLALEFRTVSRPRSSAWTWRVDYTLRNHGGDLPITSEASAHVKGNVSNSRILSHESPKLSEMIASDKEATCELIYSSDSELRCLETLTLRVWIGTDSPPPRNEDPPLDFVVPHGGLFKVRLDLQHRHFLYGQDALLGERKLILRLGTSVFEDTLSLPPGDTYEEPTWRCVAPTDQMQRIGGKTGKDALHLNSSPDFRFYTYRFPERQIRYSTRYRLTYWYKVAPGTDGGLRVRTAQLRDGSLWKSLSNSDHVDIHLDSPGRWRKMERTFKTEPDATILIMEFGMPGDLGEAWIMDVRLDKLGQLPNEP